ncbi:DnaJ domain-containing protein [Coemansia sp. RSA 1813]|nr:DnaJ sub C member 8 [Coemansia sp. RSA 1646]KAJ1770880.1 DnaJ domain-containing protein [Coemansia sp. RSA 1843]KAJ2092881.1 DnaJ domain-containing protein [Coemansia sp. RSA 986]KAJ2216202.1 DnaJ domain-containing protein [Coemansia sp. RSA 487]KAJ2570625.1 DnaJ domain-containing protein [Coemansia sp. RSA 1813]
MSDTAKEVERLLQSDSMQLSRTQEVDRVLSESPLDPFAILAVPRTCSTDDVRLAYRSKSRLIHPDKTAHSRAREAFEKLKRAESELMDDTKRKSILALMDEARREVAAQWQEDRDSQAFEEAAKAKYRAIVVDIEWRRRQKVKQEMAAEGAIKAKAESEARERRKKRDAEKAWNDGREERVNSWRNFVASGSIQKKKGKKSKRAKAKASA